MTVAIPVSKQDSPLAQGDENTCGNCAHRIYWEATYKVWRHLRTYDHECANLAI